MDKNKLGWPDEDKGGGFLAGIFAFPMRRNRGMGAAWVLFRCLEIMLEIF